MFRPLCHERRQIALCGPPRVMNDDDHAVPTAAMETRPLPIVCPTYQPAAVQKAPGHRGEQ